MFAFAQVQTLAKPAVQKELFFRHLLFLRKRGASESSARLRELSRLTHFSKSVSLPELAHPFSLIDALFNLAFKRQCLHQRFSRTRFSSRVHRRLKTFLRFWRKGSTSHIYNMSDDELCDGKRIVNTEALILNI